MPSMRQIASVPPTVVAPRAPCTMQGARSRAPTFLAVAPASAKRSSSGRPMPTSTTPSATPMVAGDGARGQDSLLGGQRGPQPLPAGEAVRHQGGLQRHDRAAESQCRRYLGRYLPLDRHGIAPIVATALAAACSPRLIPPSR